MLAIVYSDVRVTQSASDFPAQRTVRVASRRRRLRGRSPSAYRETEDAVTETSNLTLPADGTLGTCLFILRKGLGL